MQDRNLSQQRQNVRSFASGNAYLLLTLTMLFWAGNSVVARGVHELVPPLALAWLRWTIAFAIILPFAWPHLKADRQIITEKWRILALLGGLGAGLFISLYYVGLSKTTAINGLIINSAVPILIPIAAFFIYRDRLTFIQTLGIGLSFFGVFVVLVRGDFSLITSLDVHEGDIWVLAAMGVWAVYTALLREQPRVHWLSFAAITFFVASTLLFPLFVVEHLFWKQINPTQEAILAVAYVSVFPSILSQTFYIQGVRLIGGNRAGAFMHLIPMFGAVLAVLFLGEELHIYHLNGFVLILAGVWLAARGG